MEGRRRMHIFLIPISGGSFKGAFVIVFRGTNAFHAVGQTTRLEGLAEPSSLARELSAVVINSQTACAPVLEER